MNKFEILWLEVEDEVQSGQIMYHIFIVLFKLTDVSPPQWLKCTHVTPWTWVRTLASILPLFCIFFVFPLFFCSQQVLGLLLLGPLFLLTPPGYVSYTLAHYFSSSFYFYFSLFYFHIFLLLFLLLILLFFINRKIQKYLFYYFYTHILFFFIKTKKEQKTIFLTN